MRTPFLFGLVAPALLLSGVAPAHAEYIVTDLGTLGGTTSYATALNDAGQAAGYARLSDNLTTHAFLYSGGVMTDLGTLGGSSSSAYGINASGQVVGTADLPGGPHHAFVYSNGRMTDAGTFPVGPPPWSSLNSWGTGINASGQVTGGSDLPHDAPHGFLSSGGKFTDLGWIQPAAVNASGQVAGQVPLSGAALYSGGKTTLLVNLSGTPDYTSSATGINDKGQVIGQFTTWDSKKQADVYHGFLWTNGRLLDLGALPASPEGYPYSVARGINNAGAVVGESNGRAFLFSNGKLVDLNSLIPAESHWTLLNATAINNNGQIIGLGVNPSGAGHAFLLTPTAEAPEPGTLALMVVGALGLAARRWRPWRRARQCNGRRHPARTGFVLPLVLGALLLPGAGRAAAEYIVTDLGAVLNAYTTVNGINDAGQVIGQANFQGFLYSPAPGGARITMLPGPDALPLGINASGQVVGLSGAGLSLNQAFLYSGGTVTDMSTLRGSSGQTYSVSPTAINDAGQIAGSASANGTGGRAFVYSGGKLTDLGTLPGGTASAATATNNPGQVVGSSSVPGNFVGHAFLSSGGTMTDLGTLGGSTSRASAINASGQVVGTAATADGSDHAFLYSAGKMTDLGALGGKTSSANGINNAGQVVGSFIPKVVDNVPFPMLQRAFLYSDGKMVDLNTLIRQDNQRTMWTLLSAQGINNNGQIIGLGLRDGAYSAFLLTPTAESPEPGGLALMGLGGIALAGYRWRKRRVRPGNGLPRR